MLVSSIGYFNRDSAVKTDNRNQKISVVTRGLTLQEQQTLSDVPLYRNFKNSFGFLFSMFSNSEKNMKRALDMIG